MCSYPDRPPVCELDVVELINDVNGVLAGTIGTVVSEERDHAIVEIPVTDEMQSVLESLINVPYDCLRRIPQIS